MFVPRSHGGLELDLPSALRIIRALAKIDGSVGWNAMIGSGGGIFAPLLRRQIYDRVYDNGPDTIIAGCVQPAGTAEREGDHWRVNGRWPFASGCKHAVWMFGMCAMMVDGKSLLGENGTPVVRGVCLPAREWGIEDTWHVAGLKGTGSHHIKVTDALVPAAHIFDLEQGVPCIPGPLYQAVRHVLPLFHAAFSAPSDCASIFDPISPLLPRLKMSQKPSLTQSPHTVQLVLTGNSGHQQQRTARSMRDSEVFQYELGRVSAELRAARAFFEVQVESHWRHAVAGTLKDDAHLIQGTQTGTWIAAACVRVVDACFALAGGTAVYDSSPLQRRLRDLHVAAQHATVHQRHYAVAGKAVLTQVRPRPIGLSVVRAEGARSVLDRNVAFNP